MPTTSTIMTRDNFADLLTPIHKKVFFDSYNEKPMTYKQIFKTEKMNAKSQTYPHLGAFGLWQENQEGNEFNQDRFDQGQTASFEARRFDKSYDITWELCQDDLYNVMKGIGKGGSAKGLGRSLRATEETDTASVILNGFTNVGYDGKALFAKNHPLINSTQVVSNLIDGALTDESLKAALKLMRVQKDEAGIPIATRANQLVVCPELEFVAKAIVHSILQSGTNNNDVNTVPNLDIVVWDYLDDPTGLTKPWFIQDTSIDNLLFLRREEPIFGSKQLERKMDYNMYGYTRFDTGYCDWRGLVGSKGTSSPSPVIPGELVDITLTMGEGTNEGTTKVEVIEHPDIEGVTNPVYYYAVLPEGEELGNYIEYDSTDIEGLFAFPVSEETEILDTDNISCNEGDNIIVIAVEASTNKMKGVSQYTPVVRKPGLSYLEVITAPGYSTTTTRVAEVEGTVIGGDLKYKVFNSQPSFPEYDSDATDYETLTINGAIEVTDDSDYIMVVETDFENKIKSAGRATANVGQDLEITVSAGSSSTATKVESVEGYTQAEGAPQFIVGANVEQPEHGANATSLGFADLELNTDITCADGDSIVVAIVDGDGLVVKSAIKNVVVGE